MKQETLEEAYTNKTIRNWWLDKTEDERRLMISVYFKGGNSENIDTLYGIMPEEMEEIYNINIKEEPKQETTLEEAAENFYREFPSNPLDKPEWHYNRDVDCFKKRKAFINGAKWQAERSYSEEDMIKFTEWCMKSNYVYYFNGLDWTWGNSRTQHYTTSKELLISWKEQFKK